ncbi:SRPBCC family protein [Verrucomicrobiales bacterium BCK34]|nr:SRPBCC family protein [Verrucomicrobiales bacterium BCK34]
MGKRAFLLAVTLVSAALGSLAGAQDFSKFDEAKQARFAKGEAVVLALRPGEAKANSKFVTVAKLLEGTRQEIWNVINDKEDAEKFVDGVLESKVLKREGNRILVEQRTHVGGPKGAYRYRLWHTLTPMTRADFSYDGGEIKDIEGSWWIFGGNDAEHCLVVYSLHIHPGFFAPQTIVKHGMKKSMPGTLLSMQKEVLRRRGE